MNITVNTNYKGNTTETCLHNLGRQFEKAGHKVSYNDWDNYSKYDVAFFVGNDSEVRKVKGISPKTLTGILSPYLDEKRHQEEATAADFLMVDSIEMREIFLRYNKNIFIYYIFPETKELAHIHKDDKKVIIGYHGNKTHLSCAKDLSKALDDLAGKYEIEFRAIYNYKRYGKWNKNVPKLCAVKHIQWSNEDFVQNLSQCDIGVVPVRIPINTAIGRFTTRYLDSFIKNWPRYYREDYLMRFKHATNPGRIYPFSQLHIPVVADFVPSNCQVIQDGKSGFLVWSKEGWYSALEKLIISASLRNSMSQNLKTFIDTDCSPDINFKNFLKFLATISK